MIGRWDYRRAALLIIYLLFLSSSSSSAANASEDDVRCLRDLKDSLGDPDDRLTWNFSNSTVGFVCNFIGVSCWNPQENRILSLSLPSMSLAGAIPPALQFCSGATTLDLSGNSLSGPVPSSLCDWLPFLVTLDLSGNRFSGPIPPELSNCRFLNSLDLSSNSLSGQIPASLSRLDRLKHLDLSHNRLSGEIPPSLPSSAVLDSNAGLCGHPFFSRCGSGSSLTRTGLIIVIAAGVFGAAASLIIAYAVWRFCFSGDRRRKRAEGISGDEERRWAERLRTSHNRMVHVSLFQKPIVKVKVSDLMAATGDFHPDCIVAAGTRAGTSYKAVLSDGSALTVKRLHSCDLGDKQFRAEMGRIGQLRHPNIVPLLGFCVVEDERLLIYKYMSGGALSSLLQSPSASSGDTFNWPARLQIGIGAARGLAWLHHGFQIPFLHQNFSSSVVLLDEDNEPRITDVGLQRLITSSPASTTSMSPFLNGDFREFGYVPPEYASNPMATSRGDVYSFGVVLLELATWQRPTEVSIGASGESFKGNLVDWINQLAAAGKILESVDKSLCGKGDDEEISEFLRIAKSCVASHPKERPSMYLVYQSLKSIGDRHDFSEQFDEFPLVYGKEDSTCFQGEV